METRANYVMIGGFVLGILVAAFLFIYWLAAAADSGKSINVKVVFPGAVTGLPVGGQVLFNGIKVGDVSALDFDPRDPRIVIATIRVSPNAPLRKDVRATLGFQGLTGVAYVDLKGGTTGTGLLLDALNEGKEPVIYADRSFFDDVLENGRDVLRKADTTLEAINDVLRENQPVIASTMRNVETFSAALAQNSDGVKDFMASLGEATVAFSSLSGKLEGLVMQGERILAAVPDDKVEELVVNITEFSDSLKAAGPEIRQIMGDASSAVANVQQFTERMNSSLTQVEAVVNAVKPEEVQRVVAGAASLGDVLSNRSSDIDGLIRSTTSTMAHVDQLAQTIRSREDDIVTLIGDAQRLLTGLIKTVDDTGEVVAAIDPARISSIVDAVDRTVSAIAGQGNAIAETIDSARNAATNVERMSADLSARTDDVNQIITDAKTVAANLNTSSQKLDVLMDKVNTMVDGDGEGLITEATKAMTAIRKVAEAFESRAGGIADGLSRFASQGSADLAATLGQVNRTFITLQRAIENFDRAPNRVIFGGDDVPRFNGGQRR
ncbi:MlaD family protein [Pannonibacter indicus]|uniref:ABC-type transporter Mla maintaining outer membrane lipid asymmetry, periplasmic component MlaD n=1 Tax=Pannonibacter indicus TaxID=466044 RepID=A0A0K6HLL0_9HYPH|nr:MlaD family protein [Pannonibacter indicus]CUA91810.1 ABC-type transporter Mla maintaining outer membrane lipid asymmetry, periplasmic component MlaD [Pannonibacter indicus]